MHAVVNHLPIRPDADWTDIASKFDGFAASVKHDFPQMKTAVLLKVSDTEAIFVGVYADLETMQHVSTNVAAPWFAQNIRPYLAGPAARSAGEVIGGFARA